MSINPSPVPLSRPALPTQFRDRDRLLREVGTPALGSGATSGPCELDKPRAVTRADTALFRFRHGAPLGPPDGKVSLPAGRLLLLMRTKSWRDQLERESEHNKANR